MSYQGKEIAFNDFSGGLVTNRPITELATNEASDLDNIVVYSKGKGFRSRYGDTTLNSTAFNSGASLHGLGYLKLANTNEYLVCVGGAAVGATGAGITGTISTITGALTITAGTDNIWSFVTYNNVIIGFGGSATAPDAPFTWTATGNAAVLAGSPPSAYGCFQANNRIFAFRTSANPSTIYWSIVGNQADWTGTGSGSSDVWTSDNDSLTAAAVLNTNTVLLFKENSVHQMQIGDLVDGAFPVFPLFKGVGCAGKHACVVADGLVYFITPQGKMKVTDGAKIYDETDMPALSNIDDQWQATNSGRWKYTQGIRKTGTDYDHIIWLVSYGTAQTTHNRAFVWDVSNKCWLQNSTGYASNCLAATQDGTLYAGHTNGKIYKKDASTATYTDASNSTTLVNSYLTSGWLHEAHFETIKQPRKVSLAFRTQTVGQIRFSYGFDFVSSLKQVTLNQMSPTGGLYGTGVYGVSVYGGSSFSMKSSRMVGRGNFFQYKIQSPTESTTMQIYGLVLSGKESGQKEIVAR